MARIEKNQPVQEQLTRMKQDMVGAIRRVRRPRFKVILGVLGLLIVLGLAFAGTYATAMTGLVTIPFVTSVAYHEPAPSRTVNAGASVQDVLAGEFQALITQRLQSGSGQIADRSVSVEIPETALTASLQQGLAAAKYGFFDMTRAQISSSAADGLEIFLPVAQNQQHTAIRLTIGLSIDAGVLKAQATSVTIGALALPRWIAGAIFDPPLAQGLVQFNEDVLKYITLTRVQPTDGAVAIDGDLTVQVMQVPQ